jgi:hypothetical protein
MSNAQGVIDAQPQRVPDLKVSLPLRIWIGIEVVFGLMSIFTIALTPQNTAEHFAWPIQAFVVAALLGGFYIAAATFFVLALFARRWENIRVFVPASILFSSAELLATFLHWDKFSVGSTPFNVWFVSYVLPPPLFLFFYIWHQRRALPIPRPGDEPFPPGLRLAMQAIGAVLVVFAVAVFTMPALLIPIAPVAFTPLTARAFSGWVLALGMLLLLAARENDRTRARLISPFFIFALPAIGLEMSRFSEQIDWSKPSIYVAIAVLAAVFVIGINLFRGDWRRTLG